MLFLLKDGSYKTLHPATKPEKVIKKACKMKDECAAFLLECFSYLHSDLYIIVDPKSFKVVEEPITVTYTIGLFLDDTPIDVESLMTRTIVINNSLEFYRTAALLYQFYGIDNAIGFTDLNRHVEPISLSIQYSDDRVEKWAADEDNAVNFISFINENGFTLYTEKFLDASVESVDAMIDGGHYITRKVKIDNGYSYEHYWHDRKFLLRLCQGEWSLTTKLHRSDEDYYVNPIYGYSIVGSGSIYLSPFFTMREWLDTDSVFLGVTNGSWSKVPLKDFDEKSSKILKLPFMMQRVVKAGHIAAYDGNDVTDTFSFALYFPQYWNLLRFLDREETPIRIQIDFLQKNHKCKSGVYEIPPVEDNEGINIDLFAIFTKILLTEPRNISFAD